MRKIMYLYFAKNREEIKLYKGFHKLVPTNAREIFLKWLPIYFEKEFIEDLDIELFIVELPFLQYSKYNLKKIKKFTKKLGIKDLILDDSIKDTKIKKVIETELKEVNIYNGKSVMKDKLQDIFDIICQMSHKELNRYRIGILAEDIEQLESIGIVDNPSVRFINIFLKNTEKVESYIQNVYEDAGLMIENMKTIKSLVGNSDIIVNLSDFEVSTKPYNIFINIGNSFLGNKSKGVIINDIEITSNIEIDNDKIRNSSQFYEFLLKNEYETSQLEYNLTGIKGLHGKIRAVDFKT